MLNLETKIEFLPGVGPKITPKLERLNIFKVEDLIYHLPRRYDDFKNVQPIAYLKKGDIAVIEAEITEIFSERTSRKKMHLTSVMLKDESGEISATWFNQPYLRKLLTIGQKLVFRGKIEFNFQSGKKYITSPIIEYRKGIYPIYSETAGITSKFLRKLVYGSFKFIENIEDPLPEDLIKKENLLSLDQSLRKIHIPLTEEDISKSKERLAFSELFDIILRFSLLKNKIRSSNAPNIPIKDDFLKNFVSNLPFKLTDGQRKSAWEILLDLNKNVPMNRLLQGDVGSGKTVVGAIAAAAAIDAGYQVCWMAPTEILANQHFSTISEIFKPFGYKVSLLTGSQKTAKDDDQMIIGTHALIYKKSNFPRLALVIVDEQHRFGVKQRQMLKQNSDLIPHFLSLTATPIPRSLALALYGDLDISAISELPKNRQAIETRIVKESERRQMYDLVNSEVKAGRQAFVVCPLIESSKSKDNNNNQFQFVDEKKAVTKEFTNISKEIFPNFKVGLLHGKMKPQEKNNVMQEFSDGKINILVSTAVVEVGIDVPNATVMLIEGAENFGLAQLHQLRGRIGRGEHKSYCFLCPQKNSSEENARLKALSETNSGFELAERDLKLRGAGEFWGVMQSGLADLKIADLSDTIMINRARKCALEILPSLDKYPKLKEETEKYILSKHLE